MRWIGGGSRNLRLEPPTRTGMRYTRWGWAVPILPMDDIQRVLSRCLAFEGLIHASWRNKAHACLEKPALISPQRLGKSASPGGKVPIQRRCSGNKTPASIWNGYALRTWAMMLRKIRLLSACVNKGLRQ